MITRIIKTWKFDEENRRVTELITSNKIRLNSTDPANSYMQLKEQGVTGHGKLRYSTDLDISAKTRLYSPMAVLQWLLFEPYFTTNEKDFAEFSIALSDKTGNEFAYESRAGTVKVGDKICQGDFETTVSAVNAQFVTLSNGTNFEDGRVYLIRSRCNVGFRVYDSNGDEWVYDVNGSGWVAGGVSDWNSGFVISNHIAELDLATIGKGIGFVINLRTQDERYTPALSELKLLGRFDIDFAEDMIYDSLIRAMETYLRPTTEISLRLETETDTIDLGVEYKLENDGYNLTDCESAYNLTKDPTKTENIATGYTPGSARKGIGNDPGTVELAEKQEVDDTILLKMKYFPEIAVNTHLDSYEVGALPSIAFERIEKKSNSVAPNAGHEGDYIRDKLTLTGVKLYPPEQYDLIFGYAVFTGNQSDQHRIGEALHRFFVNVHHISSWGLDEPYPIVVRDEFRSTNSPNTSNVNTHVGEFRICNVAAFIKEPKDVYLVDCLSNSMTTSR
jgi:hypothetical protein